MATPKRVGHLAVQGGRSCLHTDTAIQLTSRLLEGTKTLGDPVVPLKACWLNRTEMSCYFSHLSAVTDRGEFDETLIPGFPPLLGVGTVDICCEQSIGKAEMSRGCLFPDSIPNRDVKHRLLIKLTREGSYKIGGFHCLLPKDRITWDNQYIVHIYYIHIRTVVKRGE